MKRILEIIKSEFPDKAIDLSESLELTNSTLNDILEVVNLKINSTLIKKDYNTSRRYIEIAEEITSYENKLDEIIDFLDIDYEETERTNQISDTDKFIDKPIPNYEDYRIDSNIEHTLYENFTHIRPFGFKFIEDKVTEVKTWQEMLIKTCEILIDIDEGKFLNFEYMSKMNGKKRKYFFQEADNMRNPIKVLDKIYVETNMSSNGIRNLIIKMIKEYGYNIKDYKVYFLADYTARNK